MYLKGIGIEKDLKKGFQIYSKVTDEGSHMTLNYMAYCCENGFGVEKHRIGIATVETKRFQCLIKSTLLETLIQCLMSGISITMVLTWNVKLIGKNVYKATFKTSQRTVALKCVYLNDRFKLDNLINEFEKIKRHRKLEIYDGIPTNEGSPRQYLKTYFQKMDWNEKLNLSKQIANVGCLSILMISLMEDW
ncbi:hypothetical protein Glove_275g106 [Diversispora epigaea]|uniref:Serine-threonine/tyrosine-protein kinase catalytic domain-containing protein n=1 Tax=Diversispora epigaea TaxID=1348612 RepID=A0A397I3M4_9GLOM|nr:hypothetical protein Glove_275g106 [Diversispora epigaea]